MMPKEHGAYGQMIVPLVTAFAVAGVSVPSVLAALAVVAAFVAHEPLAVLAGARGVRASREQRGRARRWLAVTAVLAAAAGGVAVTTAPAESRWSFVLPLVPAAFLVHALARGREKTWQGEIAAAVTFALAAVPVCMANGAPVTVALAVALPFAWVFTAAILAVRVVILRVRGGGRQARAAYLTRWAVLAVAGLGAASLAAAAIWNLMPWSVLASSAPGLTLAVAIAVFPPPATRLRTVGWTLVAASVATLLLVVMTGAR